MKNGVFSAFNILTAIFLCFGLLCGIRGEHDYKSLDILDGENVRAVVVVDEVVYQEVYASMYICNMESVNGTPRKGEICLEFPYETDYEPYDTLEVEGVVSDCRKGKSISEKMNLISKNRIFDMEGNEVISYNENAKNGFMYSIYCLRMSINDLFLGRLDSGAASYANALLLGDTSSMSISFKNDMSALGVSHILAVSGMHTSILAAVVMAICQRLKVHRKVKSAIIAVLAVFFMFIAGLSPSVTRSVIMLIMALLPAFFGRRGDSIISLFCSVFLICAVSPRMVMSCGLLLSFVSCLAIVVCIPSLDGVTRAELYSARDGSMKLFFRYVRKFITAVGISVCCSLVTAPIIAFYFGETSFVSVPANLVAVPLSTLSMVVIIPLLFFAKIPYLGDATAYVFTLLYKAMRAFSELFTSVGDTSVSLRYPFFVPIIIFLLTMFLFVRLHGIKKRVAFITPFLICAVIFGSCLQIYNVAYSDRAEALYMTSKTSEGFLLVSGTKTMYIDIGNGGKALPKEGAEISEEEYYTVSLDGFMLTHYHSGHISSLKNMMLWNRIEKLYLPEPVTENDREVLENIKRAATDSEIVMYSRGEEIPFGNITVKSGECSFLERSTHPVMMLNIDLGEKQIFWLGSSVTESELAIDAELSLVSAEAVIIGRHGPTMKESIKFYSSAPENIPIITTPYAFEWKYGLEVTKMLEVDEEGFGVCRFK